MTDAVLPPQRAKMIKEIELRLGGMMIDVELEVDHYNLAIDYAVQRYRQRSGHAVEESFVFIETQPDTAIYTLPQEVQEVQVVYRSSIAGGLAGGAVDPFSLAFSHSMYTAVMPGGMGFGGGGAGWLATYDFGMQNLKTMGRMFGRDVLFQFNPTTKKLHLHRKINSGEEVVLHVYNAQPEEVLLQDVYARPWLSSYAIAQAKLMLGEARALYGNLAGPQGGITLNGDSIKSEAQAEIEKLDLEIKDGVGQRLGYGFVIG